MDDLKKFPLKVKKYYQAPAPDLEALDLTGLQFSTADEELIAKFIAGKNYSLILYRLAQMSLSDVNVILEIGSGNSSLIFARVLSAFGNSSPKLCSIDIDLANPTAQAKATAEVLNVDWQVIHGDSLKVPNDLLPLSVDLLYIDGDHGGDHVRGDYKKFAPLVRAGGLVVFDDYPTAPEVTNGVGAAVGELTAAGVVGKVLTYNVQDGNSFYIIQK